MTGCQAHESVRGCPVTRPASPSGHVLPLYHQVGSSPTFSMRDVVTFLCTGLPFCGPHGLPSPTTSPLPLPPPSCTQVPSIALVRAPDSASLGQASSPHGQVQPGLTQDPRPGGGPVTWHTASRPQLARAMRAPRLGGLNSQQLILKKLLH